jgi:Protein of unknown function (DUF1592)/Protein of unknown function (DUF1588)/Protein of unknown function (DUF1595)/Protein of unknown function (DUF1585)/Protein of unknown function (DUF1587)
MIQYETMMQFSFTLRGICFGLCFLNLGNGIALSVELPSQAAKVLMEGFCIECHHSGDQKGGLDLESIMVEPMAEHLQDWESVVRKLRARQMPPVDQTRPTEDEYQALFGDLVNSLDGIAQRQPRPGRVDGLRRLNRTEYRNAIRDLLALKIDVSEMLPADESSHGFDNITVGDLSPFLLNRYIAASQRISRLAVGSPGSPGGATFRPEADLSQEDHIPGLPLGTRGGLLIQYNFPRDGEYEFQIHLTRDRNEEVEGLHGTHELLILFDRQQMESFEVRPPRQSNDHTKVDAHLKTRLHVTAGPKQVGVTFVKKSMGLLETKRQPYISRYNHHRHPRQSPAIFQVSVTGPFDAKGIEETPSRRQIFSVRPTDTTDSDSVELAARKILGNLARLAYRRPVTDEDLKRPMEFFDTGRKEGGFEAGIETALSSILVSPQFLFRKEKTPVGVEPDTVYRLSDIELATRLSFFLWSSIPDDQLLSIAERGELSSPGMLEQQTRRMLADPRSRSLIDNFANQWLYLRNLNSITPNHRLFPDFDDNLRQAFRLETELFFESILREDRSIVDLLKADYTFLNERLAKHYQIPNVYGSRFRKVALRPEDHRGGLLRQGSILTVTSYATRTSPVIRGNWILENIVGTPAPPPPANVPALDDNNVDQSLPIRERLSAHRANPACASCHNLMDPVGFALENYDAVGRWRTHQDGHALDVNGGLPDGQEFIGAAGLERGLLARPELFVSTFTEKLLTFALGRGVEPTDGPAVRKIVALSEVDKYRISSIIIGIVNSVPFRMRTAL